MSDQEQLFGMSIDRLTMQDAVSRLLDWVQTPGEGCRYVVTPNVDHTVLFQQHAGLRAAYADAGLVLADGMPVVWAARLLGHKLPQRVTGSDLVPNLFTAAEERQSLRVFLLGAAPGVAERAATKIAEHWPSVRVIDTYSPRLGFERDSAENAEILARIARARPDVLVIGLGAPKQELWVHAHRLNIAAPVALCVGATLDFLAGERLRAPAWMRKAGLEWIHRLAGEPRRLARRYARDAWIFPRLVFRELFPARN